MENELIAKLIGRGDDLEKAGDPEKAMEVYSRALDILVGAAKSYAEVAGPTIAEAVMGSGSVSQDFLEKFNDYLKKDQTAAIVSCKMGMLFFRMSDKASTRDFFEQAIDLTPVGIAFDDPHIGMEMLKNME